MFIVTAITKPIQAPEERNQRRDTLRSHGAVKVSRHLISSLRDSSVQKLAQKNKKFDFRYAEERTLGFPLRPWRKPLRPLR